MPHFLDHFVPSTWVVLRKKDDTPTAAAAEPEPVEQKSEAKVCQNFDEVIDGIIRVLFPFREAYDAVVAFLTMKAEEEQRNQLPPVVA
jgi:hypothetical protein